jgi:hypothetical protein
MHTAEPFVPVPSVSEVKVAVGKLKSYKYPGPDHIPAEFFQAGEETLRSEIHKLINLIWNKKELPDEWKEVVVVPIQKKGDKSTVVIIEAYHCCHLHAKCYPTFF